MAKLSARNRSEVIRYFDLLRGELVAVMSDGHTLRRSVFSGWRDAAKFAGPTDRCPDLQTYLDLVVKQAKRKAQHRDGQICRCEPAHAVRAWVKAGKIGPCPCPDLQPTTINPEVSFDPEYMRLPSLETIREWESDGIAESIDGCRVEPDGTCEHGSPSWLRALRVI